MWRRGEPGGLGNRQHLDQYVVVRLLFVLEIIHDISLTGFSTFSVSQWSEPPLTGVLVQIRMGFDDTGERTRTPVTPEF